MYVEPHHSIEELQQLQKGRAKPAMVLKFQALILAKRGKTAPQVAEAVARSRRTVQQWVGDYNRAGLDGLADGRGGNHRHLSVEQEQQFCAHLDAEAADPRRGMRHAQEVGAFIEQQFGVTYALSGLYQLLHRLGYEWLMPRPRHEKNDPAAIEAFKKKRPNLWRKPPPSIPASGSSSGSKTRPASASRAR